MYVLLFLMVVLVLESGKPANHPWNVFPVVLYGCVSSRTRKTCQPSLECVMWFSMVVLVLERGNLPTIPGMCVLWFSMVVLVLERGKLPTIPGMCVLWFFMVEVVLVR